MKALLQGQQELLKEQRDANYVANFDHHFKPVGSTPFTPGLDHTIRDFEYDDEVTLKKYPDTYPPDVSISPQSFIQQAYDHIKPGQLVPDSGVDTMASLNDSTSGVKQDGFGGGKRTKKPVFTKRWKSIIC